MTAVAELETRILDLPLADFAKLRSWIADLDDSRWDRQIADDLRAGKLRHLIANAKAEMATNAARPL